MKLYRTSIMRVVLLTCLLTLTACLYDNHDDDKGLQIGDTLPSFRATDMDGNTVDTSLRDDQPWVVVFFNTSCPDCQQELPLIQELYDRHSRQAHFIIMSREETAKSIALYWHEQGFTMPYFPQEDQTIYNLFACFGIPRVYIANSDGVIIKTFSDTETPTLENFGAFLQ